MAFPWAALLLCGAGCASVVQVKGEAEPIRVLHPTNAEQGAVIAALDAECHRLGSLSGQSASANRQAAMCGARNDLRNQAFDLGATVVVTAFEDEWLTHGDAVSIRGIAFRCPTAEELGLEEYIQDVHHEAPCSE